MTGMKIFKYYLPFIFSLFYLTNSFGLSLSDSSSTLNNKALHKYRFEISEGSGEGSKKYDIGETTTGEIVKISPGDGSGLRFSFGYFMTNSLSFSLDFGKRKSSLIPEVDNAQGTFSRSFILGTLRYAIPIKGNLFANLGGGIGLYQGGKLDLELSKVPDWGAGHYIREYKNSFGFHLIGETELIVLKEPSSGFSFSVAGGLRYYNISYDLNSLELNGIQIPIKIVDDPFSKLNGDGYELYFSLILKL